MATKKRYSIEDFKAELARETGEDVTLPVPFAVILGEAVDVAGFFADHWRSVVEDKTLVRPGLDRAGKKIYAALGQEILALVELAQAAQTKLILATRAGNDPDTLERARFLVSELDAALSWHFDDGVEDDKDAQLAALRNAHANTPASIDALAAELADYVGLASKYKEELSDVAEFDPDYISEGNELARALRARPGARDQASIEAREARLHRNRVLALLMRRVSLVRAASRFVYRHEPATVRKVTSAYERRRRSRKAAEAPVAAAPPDPTLADPTKPKKPTDDLKPVE